MPRLISVAMTTDAVRDRSKTVTRRKGWWRDSRGRRIIEPGDKLTLCEKVQGRKPGEPLVRICDVLVVNVRREPLSYLLGGGLYPEVEVAHEGFPGMEPEEFVQRFFVDAQGMSPDDEVTRLEWRYLEPPATVALVESGARLVKLRCLCCPYTGALSTRLGAVAAAWDHHRTHRRTDG